MVVASHIYFLYSSALRNAVLSAGDARRSCSAISRGFFIRFGASGRRRFEENALLKHHKQNKGQTLISETLCFDTNYEHFRKIVNFTIVKRVVGRRSLVVVDNTNNENGKMSFLSLQLTVDSRPFITGAWVPAHQRHYCRWTKVLIRRCILFNKII